MNNILIVFMFPLTVTSGEKVISVNFFCEFPLASFLLKKKNPGNSFPEKGRSRETNVRFWGIKATNHE